MALLDTDANAIVSRPTTPSAPPPMRVATPAAVSFDRTPAPAAPITWPQMNDTDRPTRVNQNIFCRDADTGRYREKSEAYGAHEIESENAIENISTNAPALSA